MYKMCAPTHNKFEFETTNIYHESEDDYNERFSYIDSIILVLLLNSIFGQTNFT